MKWLEGAGQEKNGSYFGVTGPSRGREKERMGVLTGGMCIGVQGQLFPALGTDSATFNDFPPKSPQRHLGSRGDGPTNATPLWL